MKNRTKLVHKRPAIDPEFYDHKIGFFTNDVAKQRSIITVFFRTEDGQSMFYTKLW